MTRYTVPRRLAGVLLRAYCKAPRYSPLERALLWLYYKVRPLCGYTPSENSTRVGKRAVW